MRSIRRKTRAQGDDAGFGLAEVIASLLIFALMSMGLLHTLLSMMTMSRDARARQVALNLAAQAIDRAREEDDLFDVLDATTVIPVGSDDYTVHMTSQWVSDPGIDLDCGAGGGILRYKRINVEVTWENMRSVTEPVRSDTLINPDERINDPSKGTILVSVSKGDGSGSAGVTVSASPVSGGSAPPPVITDSQGCAYMLAVEPGDYTINVSRAGYVDTDHQPTAAKQVSVTQGASASASFQYDLAADYTAYLASNGPASGVEVPTTMPVMFVSTYATSEMSGPTGRTRTWDMHPFASGYTAYAGSCDAADPEAWPPATVGADTFVGKRPPAVGTIPGGAATLNVPMGLVQVTPGGSSSASYLRAVSEPDPHAEHPGCATTVDLLFSATGTGTRTLALPYGSWKIYKGTSSNRTTQLTAITVVTEGDVLAGVVTLDPRTVVDVP